MWQIALSHQNGVKDEISVTKEEIVLSPHPSSHILFAVTVQLGHRGEGKFFTWKLKRAVKHQSASLDRTKVQSLSQKYFL